MDFSFAGRLESITLYMISGREAQERLYLIDDIIQHLPSTLKCIRLYLGEDIQLMCDKQSSYPGVLESTHLCLRFRTTPNATATRFLPPDC